MNVVVRPRRVALARATSHATRTPGASIGPVGLVSPLLVVCLAGLLVLPHPLLVALGVALLVAAVRAARAARALPQLSWASPVVAFAVAAVALWISAVAPFVTQPLRSEGLVLLATFIVLPVAALAACWVPRHRQVGVVLWAAAVAGATIAGVVGLFEVAVLGARRADGTTGNAIVFGDLSLVMVVLAVALVPFARSASAAGERSVVPVGGVVHGWRGITATAAVLGVVAGVVSGSRGAWLALPVMGAVLAARYRRALRVRTMVRLGGAFAAMTVGAVRLSGSMPINRPGRQSPRSGRTTLRCRPSTRRQGRRSVPGSRRGGPRCGLRANTR
jgi:O-antigen ligase